MCTSLFTITKSWLVFYSFQRNVRCRNGGYGKSYSKHVGTNGKGEMNAVPDDGWWSCWEWCGTSFFFLPVFLPFAVWKIELQLLLSVIPFCRLFPFASFASSVFGTKYGHVHCGSGHKHPFVRSLSGE